MQLLTVKRVLLCLGVLSATALSGIIAASAGATGSWFTNNVHMGPVPATPVGGGPSSQLAHRSHPVFPTPVPGLPAISPPVTEEKVRAYALTSKDLQVMNATGLSISRVTFLSAAKLRQITQEPLVAQQYGGDAPLVYVEVLGTFEVPKVEEKDAPIQYSHATMIFDAVNGNLLQVGSK